MTTTTVKDLQSSLHQTFTDFGPSVRPSLVLAAQLADKKAGNGGGATTTPSSSSTSTSTGPKEDLHALVAALSFSFSHDEITDKENDNNNINSSSSSNTKKFTFITPHKQVTPAWVLQRQQQSMEVMTTTTTAKSTTPLTVSTLQDSLSPPSDWGSTCSQQQQQQQTSQQVVIASFSPVRRYSTTSERQREDAAALAYPLSLPIITTTCTSTSSSTSSSTTTNNNHQQQGRKQTLTANTKPVKKYPKVNTNIPGAGTRRSSCVHPIVATTTAAPATVASNKERRLRYVPTESCTTTSVGNQVRQYDDDPLVAHCVHQHAKDVWMWAKHHLPLVPALQNLTEHAVCAVTRQESMDDVDAKMVRPMVQAVDENLLGPVVHHLRGWIKFGP